jgi:hypothetical protein
MTSESGEDVHHDRDDYRSFLETTWNSPIERPASALFTFLVGMGGGLVAGVVAVAAFIASSGSVLTALVFFLPIAAVAALITAMGWRARGASALRIVAAVSSSIALGVLGGGAVALFLYLLAWGISCRGGCDL